MSSTLSSMAAASSSAPISTSTSGAGSAQSKEGISLVALLTAISSSLVIFGVQMLLFILLKNKLARIYQPKTYLVPERERTEPPPRTPWGWLQAIFRFNDREIINKCGLDAYFFLRYLQTLLAIFIPLALVILPVLLPINYIGGKGSNWIQESANISATNTASVSTATSTATTTAIIPHESATVNVTGMDVLAWGNVRPSKTNRYWAHLVLALVVIIWVCVVFFAELRVYVKVRQDYLTSAEHRLRASATTVLVSAIPKKWLTHEALAGLYDVFPGGIRNIWINRNFDLLLEKIKLRDEIFRKLESAETELIVSAKKAHVKQLKKDKKAEKGAGTRQATKEQAAKELAKANADAERMAQSGGLSLGDHQGHTIDDVIDDQEQLPKEQDPTKDERRGAFKIPVLGGGLRAMGQGLDAVTHGIQDVGRNVGNAGNTVVGGVREAARDLDDQIETTNGFVTFDRRESMASEFDRYGRYIGSGQREADLKKTPSIPRGESPSLQQYGAAVSASTTSDDPAAALPQTRLPGNNVRRSLNIGGLDTTVDTDRRWWKFWQGPAGGFPSPLPAGAEGDEFPLTKTSTDVKREDIETKKSLWEKTKVLLPFINTEPAVEITYPIAHNQEYKEDEISATWEKYLKHKDRPTHRIDRFGLPGFLPCLPFINKQVDSIYWCRGELARLNLEIEMDQKEPERFPLMNSAFIQFNHQVAAHMASQAVAHHIPKTMAPRTVEISPRDVIWDNMSVKWWAAWVKTGIAFVLVAGMVVLWTIPVAWTASLTQITTLADKYTWLNWLNSINQQVLKAIAGVLPAIALAVLLILVPHILHHVSLNQGAQTGTELQRSIQNYYFAFLFVQVFLVVSISGGIFAFLGSSVSGDITTVPDLLATNIPKAANYFFSYMILQALSTSSGTLLQTGTLIMWFIMPKLFDNTARKKWRRNTQLETIKWGSFFPIYTNFACIGLIYSVVAPVIIVFAIITFTFLWIALRYSMLYVTRFRIDTGGVLYPRAINQTFTGLYVMELCLVGLFLIVRDDDGEATCIPQAIIIIIAAVFTGLYQILLNKSFGPLFYSLPITFEDEAVLRDEAFERAQARRLGLDTGKDETSGLMQEHNDIELSNLNATPNHGRKFSRLNPVNMVQEAGTWAARSGKSMRRKKKNTFNDGERKIEVEPEQQPTQLRRRRRHRDEEAQQQIADALYGGYNDEIEDLTPEERDMLVKDAFRHSALRTLKPTIWIPRDDLGVSDDEIRRTRDFGMGNIWISNVGAALDGKQKVIYGRNPPDFSQVELINL
ncbi:hypothetical protein PVAG01_00414 [Phlyctema vagabunda]|uniref:DUF221-domain-containing protein n=1 Tax=Phlyctema vagabunda TaxID=108571 RepID=A0ABR4PUJ4_9HELO